jgi:hypothetical protein
MSWNVEYTDEYGDWWNLLNEEEQDDVEATVNLLVEQGPKLRFRLAAV